MLSYPSWLTVSSRALQPARRRPAPAPQRAGAAAGASLSAGRQALLVVAYLRKGETYAELACGFRVGTVDGVPLRARSPSTLLAAMAPTLDAGDRSGPPQGVRLSSTAPCCAIDRVGMTSGYDRAFYSGKHKCHGVNVQVIADPAGRLVWISPVLPGARHDLGAAREHGIIDALTKAEVPARRRHRLPGRRPDRCGAAAASPPRPRHRPLPAAVAERRRRSTPHTLGNAARESGSTRSSRTGGSCARSAPAQARASELVAAVQSLMIATARSGWQRLHAARPVPEHHRPAGATPGRGAIPVGIPRARHQPTSSVAISCAAVSSPVRSRTTRTLLQYSA